MKYHIDAKALLNVLPFRSSGETRYNSNCIQIRAGRVWAMNGHLAIGYKLEMMKAEDLIGGEGHLQDVTLLLNVTLDNVKALAALLKGAGKQKYVIYDDVSSCICDMLTTTVLTLGLLPTFDFPDVLKCIPKPDALTPTSCYQISGDYLAQFAKLADDGLMVYYTGAGNPYVIMPASDDWLAILMPMNVVGKGVDINALGAERLAAVRAELEAVRALEPKKSDLIKK